MTAATPALPINEEVLRDQTIRAREILDHHLARGSVYQSKGLYPELNPTVFAAVFAGPLIASRNQRPDNIYDLSRRAATAHLGEPRAELVTAWRASNGDQALLAACRLAYGDDDVLGEIVTTMVASARPCVAAVMEIIPGRIGTRGHMVRSGMTDDRVFTDSGVAASWWARQFTQARRDTRMWQDTAGLPGPLRTTARAASGVLVI